MEIKDLLRRLVEATGPSGFEDEVREVITEELRDCVDTIEVDALGNLICVRHGSPEGPRVMVDAHMDEIGLMVKYTDDEGFLNFEKHGWIDDRILLSQWVKIHTERGPVVGVIGTKAAHLLTEGEKKEVKMTQDMWIDIGVRSREHAERLGVRIGDAITFDRGFSELGDGFIAGKALDNRMGCAAMIQAMKEIKDLNLEATVYAVGSVQEEVGARGTQVAGFKIRPDMALVIDTAYGEDPATSERETTVRIGHGPVVRLMDFWASHMGAITPRTMRDLLIGVAEELGIPHQREIFGSTLTDASTLHLTGEGIPTGVILIPRRYSHSPSEVAFLPDVENTVKLLSSTLVRIDREFVSGLTAKLK